MAWRPCPFSLGANSVRRIVVPVLMVAVVGLLFVAGVHNLRKRRAAIQLAEANHVNLTPASAAGSESSSDGMGTSLIGKVAPNFTLTSLDDRFSKKWERNAALPADRIAGLKFFHESGIFTWVSLEPTLDVEASLEIVRETHGFVDLFKIGKANYLKEITRTTDWKDYTLRMVDLCTCLGVKFYIKKDLQAFLPPGIDNPLRVQQHH